MNIEALPSWIEEPRPLEGLSVSRDPLGFPRYQEQLAAGRGKSGATDSVTPMAALIAGHEVVVAYFEFRFLGGSMGEATGERLERAIDLARNRRIPLVTVTASGGARMQEGMRSLVQMQRVAAALSRLRTAGVPHVNVAVHPTTGGIWASLASVADVIIAVEDATIGFAGARVRGATEDTVEYKAEGKLRSGAVDVVVSEERLGAVVAEYIEVLAAVLDTDPVQCDPPRAIPGPKSGGRGWAAVEAARSPGRPKADRYLAEYFDQTVMLTGDRAGGNDPGMLCGIGLRDGEAVAFVAQAGTANTPAGFRTAIRVLEIADRWQIPVLSLIDTPGSANDGVAEDQGIGTAIAQAFAAMASITVPVTSLVIGEGGSGGALAISAPGELWAVPSSYFSVIAPEGAAAILYRDKAKAAEVAGSLALGPEELLELGIIRGVVPTIASKEANGALT